MARREVIRIALRSGAAFVLTALPDTQPAGAAAPGAQFQQGTLHGGMFEGWQAILATTGRMVRGTIFDPSSLGGPRFTGYRVRGTQVGSVLDLDFFDLDDLDFSDPVGGGRGKKRGGHTT